MIRRSLIQVGLLVCFLLASVQPAAAYYDDVHYALNYYIARVVGYTPLQAHRLASLCVMVDYAHDTEPTQISTGVAALKANKLATAEVLGPRLAKLFATLVGDRLIRTPWNETLTDAENQVDQIPKDLEEL